jgi:hypothetical protein
VPTCTARLELACQKVLGAPGTSRTIAGELACANDIMTTSCAAIYARDLPASCRATGGTLQVGTGCGDDAQCTTAHCKRTKGSPCGVCGTPDGIDCVLPGDCPYGQMCGGDGICFAPGALGGSCSSVHYCSYGTACRSDEMCGAPIPKGGACSASNVGCDLLKGEYCDGQTCVAAASLPQPGSACLAGLPVCAGGTCSTGSTSVCNALPADGQPCDNGAVTPCLPPAVCSSGTCTFPDPSTCH